MGGRNLDGSELRVDFSEFLTIMARRGPSSGTEAESDILEAFRVFDKDATGLISASELKSVMTKYGMKLNDKEVEDLFALSNCVDSNGQIKYEELIEMYF